MYEFILHNHEGRNMPQWQGKSKRKTSGGRRKLARGKRKSEIGGEIHPTMIGPTNHKKFRIRGAKKKIRVKSTTTACITDPKTKKTAVVNIKSVVENTANPHYVRRNIITKGAIIETDRGKARVTSRPGQDGCVNALLIG